MSHGVWYGLESGLLSHPMADCARGEGVRRNVETVLFDSLERIEGHFPRLWEWRSTKGETRTVWRGPAGHTSRCDGLQNDCTKYMYRVPGNAPSPDEDVSARLTPVNDAKFDVVEQDSDVIYCCIVNFCWFYDAEDSGVQPTVLYSTRNSTVLRYILYSEYSRFRCTVLYCTGV